MTVTVSELPPGLVLNGLDGSNLLGFLAAVGTLRVVTDASPSFNWRLQWRLCDGIWIPKLFSNDQLSEDDLIDLLMPALEKMKDQRILKFYKNLNISCKQYRVETEKAQTAATLADRHEADFIAAFGCESLPISDKKPIIQDTALRTMSGAGHQHFLGSMQDLVKITERDHLRTSLFLPWQYADERPSLRWDPVDDRRYALRWKDPSDDPIRTMRGANRLAIEALPLLPTAPKGRWLRTTGFLQHYDAVWFTWPIWEVPLRMDVVRSLLSMAELQEPEPDRANLRARGVVEIYRSQRITTGKFRNFTVASPASSLNVNSLLPCPIR